MRFDREPWRKLYVAESLEHRAMSLMSRGMRDYLLRFARPDGTLIQKTEDPVRTLAGFLAPRPSELDLAAGAVQELLDDGYLSHRRGRLFITKFADAQEARSPNAERQRRYREKNERVIKMRDALEADVDLVRMVRKRDGDGCRYCGATVTWEDRTVTNGGTYDHIAPLTRGGGNEFANVVVCCRSCNLAKNNRTPAEAGMSLLPVGDVTVTGNGDAQKKRREEKRREEIPPNPPLETHAPAAPGSLAEALALPVAERSRYLAKNRHAGEWIEPQRWPEVGAVARALSAALRQPAALGNHLDRGVVAVVEAFAAGFTLEQLLAVADSAKTDPWWQGGKRGLSALSTEVIRRTLSQSGPARSEEAELGALA